MEAGDGLTASDKAFDLVGESPRSRVIIVVPVGDDPAGSALASVVSLRADLGPAVKVDQPNSRIVLRDQLPYVLPVREDHQFAAPESLPLKTLDCLREPRRSVPRQAEARHERRPAEPPPGPLARSLSSRKPWPEDPASSQAHCGVTAARHRRRLQIPGQWLRRRSGRSVACSLSLACV